MKLNELRIGNYYKAPIEWVGSFEAKIAPFGDDRIFKLTKRIFKLIVNLDIEYLNFIKPIALNDEWKNNLGIKIITDYNENALKILYIKTPYCEVQSSYIYLEYVHQLQNLYFALSGTELILFESNDNENDNYIRYK